MMNEKKNKHMTLIGRTKIQDSLYKRMTFKAIAALIGKDQTAVSKEVKLHTQAYNLQSGGRSTHSGKHPPRCNFVPSL